MNVIVAGGYGCGTTHVYRIVCKLLDAVGISYIARGASKDLIGDLLKDRETYVLKTHDAIVPGMVFLCRRNLFDAAASHLRRANAVAVIAGVRQRATLERGYEDAVTIDYEEFYSRPITKVARIANALGLDLPQDDIRRIAKETGIEATKLYLETLDEADPVTELRPDHIGPNDGKPGSELSEEFKVKVREVYDAV